MTFAESLAYLAFLVQVAANVAVVFYVLPIWRQRRLRFFPILGFSAIIGILTTITNWTCARQPMSQADYYWFWCVVQILSIADLVLYAVGVVFMVRHFQSASTAHTLRVARKHALSDSHRGQRTTPSGQRKCFMYSNPFRGIAK